MSPTVTVAVPMYNGAEHIARCIESVLDQTRGDFELLLVDDASDDQTVAIAGSFDDPRIRLVVNDHRLGAEGNWNECLRLARGRFVKLLSHDDTIHATCLERQVAILEADPGLAWVSCRRDIIDSTDRVLFHDRGLPGLSGPIETVAGLRRMVRSGTNIFGEGSAVLFRRDLALAAGGFDGRLGFVLDLEMWVRLMVGGRAHALDATLATYRVRSGQWSMELARDQAHQVREYFAGLRTDPRTGIRRIDAAIGWIRVGINARLRRVIYRWLRWRGRG